MNQKSPPNHALGRYPPSRHHLHSRLTIIGFAIVALLLGGCRGSVPNPVEHRLADCTNGTLRFQMAVREFPPYQFVLGMPQGATGQLSFRGEIIVSQSTRAVARVPIGSEDTTPCNWLPGLSGYILTWGRTNPTERLESFLTRGRTYEVEVRFSEQPPPESSLWFSAIGRVGL